MKNKNILIILAFTILYLNCDLSISNRDKISSSGKLVFATSDSTVGPPGIYTMNLDGSNLQPVAVVGDIYHSGHLDNDYVIRFPPSFPSWSSDGKMIVCQLTTAFEMDKILLMNSDGSNKRTLPVMWSANNPRWSPEGDKILFIKSQYLGENFAVSIVDSSGQNVWDIPEVAYKWGEPQVFQGDTIWSRGPSSDFQWGCENDRVYARASVNAKPEMIYILGSNPHNEIVSYDVETGNIIERLTYNDFDEAGFRISPYGKMVAFIRTKESSSSNLYLLKLETGEHSIIELKGSIHPTMFNWSTDGSKIVFAKDEDPNSYRSRYHIYMVDVSNQNNEVRLTTFPASCPDLFIQNN